MADEQPPPQRCVAGLWCGDVLDALPDLVDGALDTQRQAAVEAHVVACDWCERFGGIYGSLVASLRLELPDVPEGLSERLRERLKQTIGENS